MIPTNVLNSHRLVYKNRKHRPQRTHEEIVIEKIKAFILREGNRKAAADEARRYNLEYAAAHLEGAPADMAEKALRFRSMSEKQAWVVAKALVTEGLCDPNNINDYYRASGQIS